MAEADVLIRCPAAGYPILEIVWMKGELYITDASCSATKDRRNIADDIRYILMFFLSSTMGQSDVKCVLRDNI